MAPLNHDAMGDKVAEYACEGGGNQSFAQLCPLKFIGGNEPSPMQEDRDDNGISKNSEV